MLRAAEPAYAKKPPHWGLSHVSLKAEQFGGDVQSLAWK